MPRDMKRWERQQAIAAARAYVAARNAYYYADYPAREDTALRLAFTKAREAHLQASAAYLLGEVESSVRTAHEGLTLRRSFVSARRVAV